MTRESHIQFEDTQQISFARWRLFWFLPFSSLLPALTTANTTNTKKMSLGNFDWIIQRYLKYWILRIVTSKSQNISDFHFYLQKFFMLIYSVHFRVNCFADRCLACQNHFGSQLANYDCEGQCGLCALCNAATLSIVPGCAYCKDGIDACVDTCNRGKKLCTACSSKCGMV